jgi:hypothetical protein
MKFLSLVFAALLLSAFVATAQTTNSLTDAEIQGRQLAQELLEEYPATNFTQTGVLKIRDSKGATTNIPLTFDTVLETGHWGVIYSATPGYGTMIDLMIIHLNGQQNRYCYSKAESKWEGGIEHYSPMHLTPANALNEAQIWAPFAGSDFWIADLGLEFFHWPQQKILKHESRRTRACIVLESTNPNPTPGAYSYVDSWIDDETHGLVHAEAYDANGKLLKEFDPKTFKKVNGQWQLQDMEIRNVQTGSRTRIEFDLSGKN